MIGYSEDLQFDMIQPRLKFSNHEQLLQYCAREVADKIDKPAELILEGLHEKRRMERACMGDGLAIFDLKILGMRKPFIMLATLANELDFAAPDGLPLDMVCLVFSPQREGPFHLRRLSRISRLLKNDDLRQKIITVESESTIRSLLIDPEGWTLAA